MMRNLVDYANVLTILAFTQAIEMENQRRLLEKSEEALKLCVDVIKQMQAELEILDGEAK